MIECAIIKNDDEYIIVEKSMYNKFMEISYKNYLRKNMSKSLRTLSTILENPAVQLPILSIAIFIMTINTLILGIFNISLGEYAILSIVEVLVIVGMWLGKAFISASIDTWTSYVANQWSKEYVITANDPEEFQQKLKVYLESIEGVPVELEME